MESRATGDALDRVSGEIAEVGALTRAVAERYEGLFRTCQAELQTVADQAETLAEAAQAVIALTEAAAGALVTHFPNQPYIDCAAGCASCCHLSVAVPPGVAALIRDHVVAHFPAEAQAGLIARLKQAADIEAGPGQSGRCPLLGADDRCTVYAVRPISCRAFTSPSAARCRAFIFDQAGGEGVPQNPALYRLHRDATAALERTAAKRGLPSAQQPLARALLDALSSPG